jgi:hypothetical protein
MLPDPPGLRHLGKTRIITSHYFKILHINTNLSKIDFPGGSPSIAAKSDAGYAPLLGKKFVRN